MKYGGKYRDKAHVSITGRAGDPQACRTRLRAERVLSVEEFFAQPVDAVCPHCMSIAGTQIELGNWSKAA